LWALRASVSRLDALALPLGAALVEVAGAEALEVEEAGLVVEALDIVTLRAFVVRVTEAVVARASADELALAGRLKLPLCFGFQ
jgi:hypothetical protein